MLRLCPVWLCLWALAAAAWHDHNCADQQLQRSLIGSISLIHSLRSGGTVACVAANDMPVSVAAAW
jgi:hypothetical protein